METAILWVCTLFAGLCIYLVARNDWVRLRGIGRTVVAEVTGHHCHSHDNHRSYAAIYTFAAEGAQHEVTDQVYSPRPEPAVGTRLTLTYPVGRPDLARVPRPWLWFGVYAVLICLLAILAGRLLGWLPAPGG